MTAKKGKGSQPKKKEKTGSDGTTTPPATRSDGPSDGVPTDVPDTEKLVVYACYDCQSEHPSQKALDMHMRRLRHGPYRKPAQDSPPGTGQKVTGSNEVQDLKNELAEKHLRIKLKKADDELERAGGSTDSGEVERLRQELREVKNSEARKKELQPLYDMMTGLKNEIHRLGNPGPTSKGNPSGVEDVIRENQFLKDAGRWSEIRNEMNTRMSRLEVLAETGGGSDIDTEVIKQGSQIAQKGIDTLERARQDLVATRREVVTVLKPLVAEMGKKFLKLDKDPQSRPIEQLPDENIQRWDKALENVFGADYKDKLETGELSREQVEAALNEMLPPEQRAKEEAPAEGPRERVREMTEDAA